MRDVKITKKNIFLFQMKRIKIDMYKNETAERKRQQISHFHLLNKDKTEHFSRK